MPHRKGLGELATDQRAETELGRLVLRGVLTADQGLAGETYLSLWRGYVFSLAGPSELSNGGGAGLACDGCPDEEARKWCRCSFRRRIWLEAYRVLYGEGDLVARCVRRVVIDDAPGIEGVGLLQLGLDALARHFGLIGREKCEQAESARPGIGMRVEG